MKKSIATILSAICLSAPAARGEVPRTALDNPNATAQAVQVYDYLLDLTYGGMKTDKMISGHWLGGSFRPGKSDYPFTMGEVTEMRKHSGKWIGMIDAWICCGEFGLSKANDPLEDCMWYDHLIADYQLWWNNGGICHIDASFYAPMADGYWLRFEKVNPREVNYANILEKGTPENRNWMAICERMSEFFLALQAKGVPVIFRPFTEGYIPVFWYSQKRMGSEMCITMWRQLHDYLTKEKGCNNIIWDFQGDHTYAHYPGDDYVDLITTRSEYLANEKHTLQCLERNSGMPVGNGELGDFGPNGKIAESRRRTWMSWLDDVRANCPELSFYITWDRQWGPVPKSKVAGQYPEYHTEYDRVLNDPYVITRERIPVTPRGPQLPYKNDFSGPDPKMVTFRGKWEISNGTLKRSDEEQYAVALLGGTDWTNYTGKARIVMPGKGNAGIVGRCTSANIFYAATVGNGMLKLWKCYNGTWIELAQRGFTATKGENLTLEITFSGIDISASAAGVSAKAAVSASDDSIPAGCTGVFSRNSTLECDYIEAVR